MKIGVVSCRNLLSKLAFLFCGMLEHDSQDCHYSTSQCVSRNLCVMVSKGIFDIKRTIDHLAAFFLQTELEKSQYELNTMDLSAEQLRVVSIKCPVR